MTPTQKAAMQAALDALEDCRHGCEEPHKTASAVTALRAALAEPMGDPVYQLQLANGDWRNITKASYDYNRKFGRTVRVLPPAEVPLLTPEEISALFPDGIYSMKVARAIEQAVHQKAGLR